MMILYVFLGVLLVVAIAAIITVVLTRGFETKLKSFQQSIFLGKLSDNASDDINKAMKYLKLTNSIKQD